MPCKNCQTADRLSREIYAINAEIKAVPGGEPTRQWRALMDKKRRMLNEYWEVGGTKHKF